MRLRLPSIVGYIAGGVLVGNIFAHIVDHSLVSMISQSGVILLLFALGVEFSFHKLHRILHVVSWPAIAQILITFALMLLLLIVLRMPFIPSLYVASAVALSSTAIVVKLLSERGELDTVPAELATGWLVIQDLAVVPMLIVLTAVSSVSGGEGTIAATSIAILWALGKAALLLLCVVYLGRHGIPRLLTMVAGLRNREVFLLTTIGIVFFVGLATHIMGLSVALGAFIAGLMVAETSQNHAVFAEIRPLRDLFAVVFFVSLGMELSIATLGALWPIVLSITVGVILVKVSIIFGLLRFIGYHRKTAFLVGMYLMQVSEFGFVLAQAGLGLGVVTRDHASILIAVTFLTIMISAPFFANADALYYRFNSWIKKFPKFFPEKEEASPKPGYPIRDHVVVCGYGRVGRYIGRALQLASIPFLVVDYNQHVLKLLKEQGIITIYGDPADKDVLDYAQVDLARSIVIAIPDRHTQEMIIGNSLSLNRRIKIICRTHHEEDQKHLKSLGVQTVIQPEFEASLAIVNKLFTDFGIAPGEVSGKMSRLKIEHGAG